MLGLLSIALSTARALAHGDAHVLILDVNRQLEQHPRDAKLLLRRGELHRLDGNWTNALTDLDAAARIDPALDPVDLERGRVYFDAGQPERATNTLNRFLGRHPTNVVALVTRARCLAWLGQHAAAVTDYTAAIRHSPGAGPDLFIERAAAARASGSDGLDSALRGLDEAIAQYGPLVTLETTALEFEVDGRRWESALKRIDRLAASSPRKDRWWMRRAEILEQAGRTNDSRTAWVTARQEFEALPPRMRETRAGQQQAERLRTALGDK